MKEFGRYHRVSAAPAGILRRLASARAWLADVGWTRDRIAKLARFALVGISTSGIYAAVVLVSVEYLSLEPRLSSAIAYLIALPFNFILHREYTFLATGRLFSEGLRFVTLHMTNMVISVGLIHVTMRVAGWSVLVGIAVVVVALPLVQFLLLEGWVFSQWRDAKQR